MQNDPTKLLELHVGIALGCLRRTTVRGFAGCGQSRRRDLNLIPSMAATVARDITISLTFQKYGATVILTRIARHIEAVLQDVPDAQARAWAGIDATARDDARHAITACITRHLFERYKVLPTPRPTIVPASGVWCGPTDAKPEKCADAADLGLYFSGRSNDDSEHARKDVAWIPPTHDPSLCLTRPERFNGTGRFPRCSPYALRRRWRRLSKLILKRCILETLR